MRFQGDVMQQSKTISKSMPLVSVWTPQPGMRVKDAMCDGTQHKLNTLDVDSTLTRGQE